jgi:1,4-alpha-glucan branching enzyme
MKKKQTAPTGDTKRPMGASRTAAGAPSLQRVRLEFLGGAARKVCVAGSFNNWHPDATEMLPVGGGKWVLDLALRPGRYEYQLVVDGEWRVDPTARQTVPNPFGGHNSLLLVGENT